MNIHREWDCRTADLLLKKWLLAATNEDLVPTLIVETLGFFEKHGVDFKQLQVNASCYSCANGMHDSCTEHEKLADVGRFACDCTKCQNRPQDDGKVNE